MKAWLENAAHEEIPLSGSLSLGRLPENGLRINDPKVSRRHALIYPQNSCWWLVDFGSRNRTRLGGRPLHRPAPLRDRDVIELGDTRLVFRWKPARSTGSVRSLMEMATTQDAGVIFAASGTAVILLDEQFQPLHASPQAGEWLAKFFGPAGKGNFPPRIVHWFKQAAALSDGARGEPLVAGTLEHRLVARLSKSEGTEWLLLLTEERPAYSVEMLESLGLTPRESEVMHWVAEGKTNSEITIILNLSLGTVNKHVQSIFDKLGVQSRQQAAMEVLRRFGPPEI